MEGVLQFLLVDVLWGFIILKVIIYGIAGKKIGEYLLKQAAKSDRATYHIERWQAIIDQEVDRVRAGQAAR